MFGLHAMHDLIVISAVGAVGHPRSLTIGTKLPFEIDRRPELTKIIERYIDRKTCTILLRCPLPAGDSDNNTITCLWAEFTYTVEGGLVSEIDKLI